jgi:hypothetical protein
MAYFNVFTSIGTILGIIVVIAGFLYWHFKTVNGFKDELHRIELKLKDLEKKDELQQETINQLKELYPIFKHFLEQKNKLK